MAIVPKDVNEELTTLEPRVLAERTSVPSILYVLLEARFKFSLDLSEVFVWSYNKVLFGPIWIPAPSARASVVAVVAMPTIKSASSIAVEFIIVCVPSTNKSPLILKAPVLSPTAAGSIIISAGPVIEPTLILIPVPTAPVDSLVAVRTPTL